MENADDREADPLVLDFVEWIACEPRPYAEVVETWRTSCPRLTIWEDAADHGYVTRATIAGRGVVIVVTAGGTEILHAHGRGHRSRPREALPALRSCP
jgi:hypothetical protein